MHGVFLMGSQYMPRHRMRKHRPKRLDSSSDRLLQTIFNRQQVITDIDKEYLVAAEFGDLATVQSAIQEYNVNINCLDHLGRSALELSLMGDHQAVVEYLLPRSNLQAIEDGLLYAISKDNVKMCELILEHPIYRNNRIQLNSLDGIYQRDSDSPRLRATTTPLILAAQRNNFYIVQLLLMKGNTIGAPHDYFCDCIECTNMRVFDSVKYSRSRLNTYQALASPAFITLSSEDPILTAFRLSHQLERLADIEKEYKSEYRRLSELCKNYAVELLDLCQSTEEIVSILNEGSDEEDEGVEEPPEGSKPELESKNHSLARVKLALKYDQKRFISHATSQRQLISLWYSGMPWMQHQHMVVKLLSVPLATLLLPITTLVFLLAPKSKFGQIMRSPFVKFLHHTCAYIVFLVLVFMASLRGGSSYPWLDIACRGVNDSLPDSVVSIMILIWVLGMFFHECRQLWREGPLDYFTDWWNWMDSSLIMLYLAYFAVQIVGFFKISAISEAHVKSIFCPNLTLGMTCRYKTCIVDQSVRNLTWYQDTCEGIDDLYTPQNIYEEKDKMSEMNQMSDIFFSLANILSFARIAHLLPANEQLGPLLVSFGRMMHDVSRFIIVFLLVFLAFLCGLTSLYRVHQCENYSFARIEDTLQSLFWATFGMGDTKSAFLDDRYLASPTSMVQTHSTHHPLTVPFGYTMFCLYILGAVVIMLNMLIAMMSNSFQEIYDDRDVEWKFARAKLWSDFFEDGCTLPTPFNLIPNPKYFVRAVLFLKKKVQKERSDPPVQMAYIYTRRKNGMVNEDLNNVELPKKPESLYRRVTRRLVQRYVYKKQSELADKVAADRELEEMKQDVASISMNMDKLRHELNYLRGTLANGRKAANGIKADNTRSRTELHV